MVLGSAGTFPSWSIPPFNAKLARGMKKALNFPGGTNGYTQRTLDGNMADIVPMSVSAWIYPDGPGVSDDFIYSRDVRKTFDLNLSSGLDFFVDYATTNLFVSSNNDEVVAGKWQYVAVTWDGTAVAATGVKLFVDAHEVAGYVAQTDGAGAIVSDAGGSAVTRIGNASNEQNGFDGYIANVKVWKRALTKADIVADFDNPWAIIDNYGKRFYIGVPSAAPGGGSSTATPALAKITVLVNAPTVKISRSATAAPAIKAITVIVNAPAIVTGVGTTATPALKSVTVLVNAPTVRVSVNATAAPAVKIITVLVNAPTVKVSRNAAAAPLIAAITILVNAPTVTVGGNRLVQPSVAIITFSVGQPTITTSVEGGAVTISILLKSRIDTQPVFKSRIEQYLTMESSLINQ